MKLANIKKYQGTAEAYQGASRGLYAGDNGGDKTLG